MAAAKSSTKKEPEAKAPQYKDTPVKVDPTTRVIAITPAGKDIVVSAWVTYKGRESLDIRRFYLDETDELWKPTAKGVRVARGAEANALVNALAEAE